MYERREECEGDVWSVVCDVVCGKDEGINGAWEGGGERIRKGGGERSKPSSHILGEPPG